MSSSLAGNGFSNNLRDMQRPRDRYRAVAGSRTSRFPVDNKLGKDIDVNELVGTHNKRKEQRTQIYEMMYRKCCHRIRYANDVQYVKECYFKVPEVQLWGGVPRYHLNAVLGYIMIRLKQKGFDVKFMPPDGVLINWGRIVNRDARPATVIQKQNHFDDLPIKPSQPPQEKVIRYELDETTTKSRKPDGANATATDRLLHHGCKRDCCSSGSTSSTSRLDARHAREELERRRQQDDIERLIAERDRNGGGGR